MPETGNAQLTTRMPWLCAEPESIWEITGTHSNGRDVFTRCLAMVLPYRMTAGRRVFAFIHPAIVAAAPSQLISPDRITSARRLALVLADEPRTAYLTDDQDLIDRGAEHV